MKVLILLSCSLALVLGWDHGSYHGEQHIPVIHKGVPIETPEVQFAKAVHLEAVAKASAEHGGGFEGHDAGHLDGGYEGGYDDHSFDGGHEGGFEGHDGGYEGHDGGFEGHDGGFEGHDGGHGGGYGYSVQHVSQDSGKHGIPAHYTNEVGNHVTGHHLAPAYETTHTKPLIDHDGKPLDTPEVEEAKAHHFAAVHEALARTGSTHHYRRRRGIESYGQSFEHHEAPSYGYEHADFSGHEDLSGHDFSGHEEFSGHDFSGHDFSGHDFSGHEETSHGEPHGFSYHQVHAPVYGHQQTHSYHHEEPQIGHDGKPLDTAEVEHAKALHFAAHEEAALRLHGHSFGGHEGPVDTPEVQHAKALHFAAHAAAKAQHYHH